MKKLLSFSFVAMLVLFSAIASALGTTPTPVGFSAFDKMSVSVSAVPTDEFSPLASTGGDSLIKSTKTTDLGKALPAMPIGMSVTANYEPPRMLVAKQAGFGSDSRQCQSCHAAGIGGGLSLGGRSS